MKLFRKALTALILALGLTMQMAIPADALSAGGVAFVVRVRTSTGLGYPVLTPPNAGTFEVASTSTVACADVAGNVNKPGKAPVEAGVSCRITAKGTFAAPGANCGRSFGTVSGTLTTSSGTSIAYAGNFETAGSGLVISGTATKSSTGQSGPIVVVGVALPDPLAGTSCTNKTQREFIIVGVAVTVLT